MAKKTKGAIKDILKGHIDQYGIVAFSDTLDGLGWILNLRLHSKIKVLADTDVIEFKPERQWEGPAFGPAGQSSYKVKRGGGGKIKVTHADGTTQKHGPYAAGKTVIFKDKFMYLPS